MRRFAMNAIVSGLLWLALALAGGLASAADDVGLINQISGEVTYRSAGAVAARAGAFMKLREGDSLRVAAGARVRVVYFDGGRQELWEGPAEFSTGRRQGSGTGRSTVTQLPGGVPQALAQTPELMQIVKLGRPGAVTVRGLKPRLTAEQNAAVQQARDTYKAMQSTGTDDDITPELYLLNVLRQYALHDEIKQVAKRMQAKQPAQQEVMDIAAWANGLGENK